MEVKNDNDNDIENNNKGEIKKDKKEENKEVLNNQKVIENKEKNDDKNINNKEDINLNNVNNNLQISACFQRINNENEMDKISSGLYKSQNNIIINIDDNKIKEKKEEEKQEESKKEENLNTNNILGDIFRCVIKIKSKHPKEKLSVSLYKINLDNESKDFSSIIKAKIIEIKENTLNIFDQAKKEFDIRYNEYIKELNKFINENELKLGKLLENQIDQIENENILDFTYNHIFEKFENIFEIHQNIIDSIKEHFGLLKLLLEQNNLIQQKNPLECYINNNASQILDSWFLNKIDYQNLNLSNIIINKYLSNLCTNYLCKKKENNFSNITINNNNKGIFPFKSNFIKDNLKNLKKIKFIELKNNEKDSFISINNSLINVDNSYITASKLNSLTLINSDLSSMDLNKISSPSLIKLKIKKNNLSLNLNYFLGTILDKSLSLKKLYLQRCFIDNQSLSEALEFLSNSPKILESLQFLSFSRNDITKVDLTNNLIKKQCVFKSLQYIDCSRNNIYDFSQNNFQAFPELKVLDLTNNNMSNHFFFENVRKLPDNIVLLSNNMFINNNSDNAEDYRKYLNNKLTKFSHKIIKLDFSYLFYKNKFEKLIDLKLTPMIKISLIKLNLSFCGLDNTTIYKFLKNNFGLLNLKELNLSNNFITIEIFNLILKSDILLDNLYSIDLSYNNINSLNLDDFKHLELFIQLYSKLKKIKFQGTEFLQLLKPLYDNKESKEEIEKINQRLFIKGFKFIVGTEFKLPTLSLESVFELKDKEIYAY